MKENNFLEMNTNEIKEAIKQVKQCIKKGVITYTHANPIEQNCYISSGDVIGLYFPNSEIDYYKEHFDFVAVVKKGEKLGICYEFKEDFRNNGSQWTQGYFFASFDELLNSPNELRLIEAINKDLRQYNDDLEILNNIKLIYKKDGGEFKNLAQAIEQNPSPNITILSHLEGWHNDELKISYSKRCKSAEGVEFNVYKYYTIWGVKSYNDIATKTAKEIEQKKQYIAQLQSELKQVKTICKRAEDFKAFLNQFDYTIKEQVKKYML